MPKPRPSPDRYDTPDADPLADLLCACGEQPTGTIEYLDHEQTCAGARFDVEIRCRRCGRVAEGWGAQPLQAGERAREHWIRLYPDPDADTGEG